MPPELSASERDAAMHEALSLLSSCAEVDARVLGAVACATAAATGATGACVFERVPSEEADQPAVACVLATSARGVLAARAAESAAEGLTLAAPAGAGAMWSSWEASSAAAAAAAETAAEEDAAAMAAWESAVAEAAEAAAALAEEEVEEAEAPPSPPPPPPPPPVPTVLAPAPPALLSCAEILLDAGALALVESLDCVPARGAMLTATLAYDSSLHAGALGGQAPPVGAEAEAEAAAVVEATEAAAASAPRARQLALCVDSMRASPPLRFGAQEGARLAALAAGLAQACRRCQPGLLERERAARARAAAEDTPLAAEEEAAAVEGERARGVGAARVVGAKRGCTRAVLSAAVRGRC